ncbi:MAG: hypothetical protein KatS3mg129_2182 [Leptospiraceae bacterium]|nr:MAG: hypothetical protein KatS3mg129_2182 [Leptospiraceae bacterium]
MKRKPFIVILFLMIVFMVNCLSIGEKFAIILNNQNSNEESYFRYFKDFLDNEFFYFTDIHLIYKDSKYKRVNSLLLIFNDDYKTFQPEKQISIIINHSCKNSYKNILKYLIIEKRILEQIENKKIFNSILSNLFLCDLFYNEELGLRQYTYYLLKNNPSIKNKLYATEGMLYLLAKDEEFFDLIVNNYPKLLKNLKNSLLDFDVIKIFNNVKHEKFLSEFLGIIKNEKTLEDICERSIKNHNLLIPNYVIKNKIIKIDFFYKFMSDFIENSSEERIIEQIKFLEKNGLDLNQTYIDYIEDSTFKTYTIYTSLIIDSIRFNKEKLTKYLVRKVDLTKNLYEFLNKNTPYLYVGRKYGGEPKNVIIYEPKIIKKMLKLGANPNKKIQDNDTIMHTFFEKLNEVLYDPNLIPDKNNLIYIIIKNGGNINIQDNEGNTPLLRILRIRKNNEPTTGAIVRYVVLKDKIFKLNPHIKNIYGEDILELMLQKRLSIYPCKINLPGFFYDLCKNYDDAIGYLKTHYY